jgi:hypothetical protein
MVLQKGLEILRADQAVLEVKRALSRKVLGMVPA